MSEEEDFFHCLRAHVFAISTIALVVIEQKRWSTLLILHFVALEGADILQPE